MSATSAYEIKSSELLRTGHVVFAHGMLVYLDGSPRTHEGYDGIGTVYSFRGLVLNRDEVSPNSVPLSFTAPDSGETGQRWTIQGTNLAKWAILTPAATLDALHKYGIL